MGTCVTGNGTAIFVDQNATGDDTGLCWTDAYTSLQDALNDPAIISGDIGEIWVAAGTYTPDVRSCTIDMDCDTGAGDICDNNQCTWTFPRLQTFQLLNGVAIYGGFAGVETDLSQRIRRRMRALPGTPGNSACWWTWMLKVNLRWPLIATHP